VALTAKQRIARLDAQLAERDARLAEFDAQLAERDAKLAELDAQLAERDVHLAERDAKLAALDSQLAERDVQLAERDEKLAKIEEQLKAALARIEELEAKLSQSSSNSSKPPSSDPWFKGRPQKPRRQKGKRKQGGQKGHKGHHRELLPPEQCRNVEEVHPEQCRHCGSSKLIPEGSEPVRHQVTDIPVVKPFTDEWRLNIGLCVDCGQTTVAELPAGVPRSNFGPALVALVALLTGVYRVGKRGVQQLLLDVFNVTMSLGGVSNCERQVSEALEASFDEARDHVQQQGLAHADETGWRECSKKVWLWVMATAWVSVFYILPGRTKQCAQYVIGTFKGILVTDRCKSYFFYTEGKRQICWAHLVREFVGFSERGGITGEIGDDLLKLVQKMFEWWDELGDGKISRASFRRRMKTVRCDVEELLAMGKEQSSLSGKFKDILAHRDALWTFVDVEGVQPTNNHAEQQVRHAVLIRKISGGTQSERGSRFIERMLTVVASLRKQQRNVHSFVTEACRANLRNAMPPSLVPSSSSESE
jgi:transposase